MSTIESCEVKVCRICFATDCQLYLLHKNMQIYKGYEAVTGLMLADKGDLPPYLCTSCADQLMTCVRFRHRSLQAHFILLDILKNHGRISFESIQAVRTTHGDTDIEYTEEGRILDVKIEIKCEDNANRIAAQLRDEIKTECMRDDEANEDLVGDEGIAPCVKEINDIVKVEVFDETSVNDLDDKKLRTGEGVSVDVSLLSGQEDKLNMVQVREKIEVTNNLNQTEDAEVNEKLLQNIKLSCDLCGYENDIETHFLTHLRAHTETSHNCKMRAYKTDSKKTITSHTTIHNDTHICDTCGKSFREKSALKCHTQIHFRKPYCCDVCKKSYHSKSDLEIHMRIHSVKSYACESCSRSFNRKGTLQRHMLTHSSDKPYSCEVCKKSYRTNNDVKRHMQTHASDKPYSCEICEKSFRTKHNLNNHTVIHSRDKPFKCNICEASFRDKSNLRRHKLLHVSDKQYSCDLCDKSYRWQSDFKRHMLVHAGIKAYTCDICKKSLSQKCYLRNHLRIHTGDQPFSCGLCKKSFSHKTNLQRHMTSVHSVCT